MNVLRNLKKHRYDERKIVSEFTSIRDLRKKHQEIAHANHALECKIVKYKDTLPLAMQLAQFKIEFQQILAFHSCVHA
jgi:hypothetical protein